MKLRPCTINGKKAMKDIQDYIDELEDLAWEHSDSYKINEIRNRITELLVNTRQEDFRDWIIDNWDEIENDILKSIASFSKQKLKNGETFDLTNIIDRDELKDLISINLKTGLLNVIDTYGE